ncbi:MAG: flagellar protein export ATPase FliI [Gammaproteobacteria bacterium]|nr:flagellar protein export ATPase FliI [Gammaproteobacteria bacterium]
MTHETPEYYLSKQNVHNRLSQRKTRLDTAIPIQICGKLTRMVGLTLEAVGIRAVIGGRCLISSSLGLPIEAEVVGFSGGKTYLMPVGDIRGLVPNASVYPVSTISDAPAGPELLGRVLDGTGKPLDGKGPLKTSARVSLNPKMINPLDRKPIEHHLDVGVRAINALYTVGRGQRMGLFAGSGVGKSVLLGMMTRFTNADVIVVGLIGERGREVKEFIERILGEEGMSRAVVVATPADMPPLMRLHGASLAASIAEYFRDQGKNVLLLMDSLTRYAQAQREIALAIGEPPATKGYPPSVFFKLPQLVERAGNSRDGVGSITAFYTVLTEGDDGQDPIADAARAILDGHIVLSRRLADMGHYPAIEIEGSISRVMNEIVSQDDQMMARKFRQIYSTYEQNRDLISIGAYAKGSDKRTDEAIALHPSMTRFLQQGIDERVTHEESCAALRTLFANDQLPVQR